MLVARAPEMMAFRFRWTLHHALPLALTFAVQVMLPVTLRTRFTIAVLLLVVRPVVVSSSMFVPPIAICRSVPLFVPESFRSHTLLLLLFEFLHFVVIKLRCGVPPMWFVARVTVLLRLNTLVTATPIAILTVSSVSSSTIGSDTEASSLNTRIRSCDAAAALVATRSVLVVVLVICLTFRLSSIFRCGTRCHIVLLILRVAKWYSFSGEATARG